jgi:hypothetical protein
MSTLAVPACRNCGAAASGKYCAECGQGTALHPPTVREFADEVAGHYVASGGALWRTLAALAVPGRLTLEYFAGRRRRYIAPLRLYLAASVVFFLVAKVIVPVPEIRLTSSDPSAGGAVVLHCDRGEALCDRIEARMRERFGALTRAQLVDYSLQRLFVLFPYAMFVLVPVFALLTRATYWNRPYNLAEHLVFALHVHAFAFLLGALVTPLHLPMLMTVPVAIYLGLALGNVFGGRAWPRVLRFLAIFLVYFVLLAATIVALMLGAVIL